MTTKFKRLRDQLGLAEYECVGLLSTLWLVTAQEAPDGGIGKLSDEDIAYAVGWTRSSPGELVAILVERHWLDVDPVCRLVCHAWSEHCEDSIDARLARGGRVYADGSLPRMKKIPRAEQPHLIERCGRAQEEWHRLHSADIGDRHPPMDADGCRELPKAADSSLDVPDAHGAAPTVPFHGHSHTVPFRSVARCHAGAGGSRASADGVQATATAQSNTTQPNPPNDLPLAGTVHALVAETVRKSNTTRPVMHAAETPSAEARDPPAPAWQRAHEQDRIVNLIVSLTGDHHSLRNWRIVVPTLCQTEAGHRVLLETYQDLAQRPRQAWPDNAGKWLNNALRAAMSDLGLKPIITGPCRR